MNQMKLANLNAELESARRAEAKALSDYECDIISYEEYASFCRVTDSVQTEVEKLQTYLDLE